MAPTHRSDHRDKSPENFVTHLYEEFGHPALMVDDVVFEMDNGVLYLWIWTDELAGWTIIGSTFDLNDLKTLLRGEEA